MSLWLGRWKAGSNSSGMTSPRFYKTEAIVLRHVPWGEADVILSLLTPNLGKLRAVARGSRRIKSKVGGHVEPLTRVSLSLTTGKGLDIVTGAQAIDSHRSLREDLDLLSASLYCTELSDALVADEQLAASQYHLLRRTLEWMEQWASPQLLISYFELRLVDLSGFLPELYYCVWCRSEIVPDAHAFSPSLGGVLCPNCYNVEGRVIPLPLRVLKVLRYFLRETPENVSRLGLTEEVSGQVEQMLRRYITFILERELHSTRFLYRLKQLRARIESTAEQAVVPQP